MIRQRQLLAAGIAIIMLIATACAAEKPPLPVVDPFKEQVTVLQKQLLELQTIQIETQKKLEEQTELSGSLSARIKTLEEENRKIAQSCVVEKVSSGKNPGNRKNKKRKTKPLRRQEQ